MAEINGMAGAPLFTDEEVRETAGFRGWPAELDEQRAQAEAQAQADAERERARMEQHGGQ